MNKKKMNDLARRECSAERTRVLKRSTGQKDQTIVTVACALKGGSNCKIGKNGDPSKVSYIEKVRKALETLGSIGGKSKYNDCKFDIGRCAEPHAANRVLQNRNNAKKGILDLDFGSPYRSRTKCLKGERVLLKDGSTQKHIYCNNCKRAFNL